jgi:antirestriction protein ArdC
MVMKTISEKRNMYAIINNMILEKLQNGKAPWRQTWNDYGLARNSVSKKAYRGINATTGSAYTIADALEVSLDYLIGEGINSKLD